MHNFSISKSSSATITNATASTSTSTCRVSQPKLATGQRQQGSFFGLSATIYTPESPLIPETYYQQDKPRLLSDARLLSEINPSQVDPFEILATHQTFTFEDQDQIQEQLDEFPLPFDELLQPINDFDPMASENPDDVNLSISPNKNDERIKIRTTTSISEQEILPSNNNHFQQALTGIVPEALLFGITGDPKLLSSRPQAYQRPDPTEKWIVLTGDKKKPFECGYEGCGKRYTRKNDLRLHFVKHTGDSPYKCYMGECTGEVAFCKQHELTRHIHVYHTFVKPFECKICKKQFRRKDTLDRHSRNIHTKQNEQKSPKRKRK